MKDYIEERAVELGNYIVEKKATVRQTAKKFGISKSTVHKDVTERLASIRPSLAERTREVLEVNKQERHIRGGWLQGRSTCIFMKNIQSRMVVKYAAAPIPGL